MNPVLDAMLRTGETRGADGASHRLHSHVSRNECEFIERLIAGDASIRRTLEVGCGYGVSALAICGATRGRDGAAHTMIDPNQSTEWHDAGVAALRRAGLDRFELIAEPSEFALPRLAQSAPGAYDFVFIDGWHTFDHTLLDIFYADRLVRAGGYIVIDDATMASVSKAVSCLATFPGYEPAGSAEDGAATASRTLARALMRTLPRFTREWLLPRAIAGRLDRARQPSMVAFRKVREEARDWSWFRDF